MWQQIIKILKARGFSQKALAERVGVDQSTICRLSEGLGPEPRFNVGLKLIRLAGGTESQDGCPIAERLDSTLPIERGQANVRPSL